MLLAKGIQTRGMVTALEKLHRSIQQTFISQTPVTAPGTAPSTRNRRINNTKFSLSHFCLLYLPLIY